MLMLGTCSTDNKGISLTVVWSATTIKVDVKGQKCGFVLSQRSLFSSNGAFILTINAIYTSRQCCTQVEILGSYLWTCFGISNTVSSTAVPITHQEIIRVYIGTYKNSKINAQRNKQWPKFFWRSTLSQRLTIWKGLKSKIKVKF